MDGTLDKYPRKELKISHLFGTLKYLRHYKEN